MFQILEDFRCSVIATNMASTSGKVFFNFDHALDFEIYYKVCVDARGKERMLKKCSTARDLIEVMAKLTASLSYM